MASVVGKSRNPIVQAAFAGLHKEQRAEKKSAKAPPAEPIPAKKAAKKPTTKGRK